MELRHLRYFIAVAEELNFTRAALRLGTAQPSLSQQIKHLEAYIGVPLLARSKRRVQLTEAGRVLLREAREILARAESAVRLASAAGSGYSGEISVGFVPAAEVKVLPVLLPLMDRRLPGIRLVLHNLPSIEQIPAFRRGAIQVGILRGPLVDPDLEVEEILRESMVAVLPANHKLARHKSIPLRLLDDQPWITISREGSPPLHDALAAFYARAQMRVREVQRADNVLGNLNMVRAGLGLALLPDYVKAILPAGLVTRPIECDSPPTVSLVVAHRRDEQLPALRPFMETLRECFVR